MIDRPLARPRAIAAASLLAALALATACGGKERTATGDSAAGAVATDTGTTQLSTITRAVGPLIAVTSTDQRSVRDATQLELTEQRLRQFMAAAESLDVLRGRDASVQALAARRLDGAGARDENAGLKLLESNPAIVRAIQSAGLSTRDYYVTGIALASAAHYIDSPSSAPPTPSAQHNAALVRGHAADLTQLRTLSDRNAIVVTPASDSAGGAAAPAGGSAAARH